MSTDIGTVAFPDPDLLAKVRAHMPDSSLRFVVWSADHPDADPTTIDAVILPYEGAQPTIDRLGELSNVQLIQTQTTGYDNVIDFVPSGARLATAAGVHAGATAELAVGLAIAKLRGIDVAARDMVGHQWRYERRRSLSDRRVLLIGVGTVGEAIAARLAPFEVELTRVASRARDDEFGQVHGVDEVAELLPSHDVVIVITPLTPATRHLVDAQFLAAMPDGALLVNVARGQVADTDAITAEAQSGRLNFALDVIDPEPLPADHRLWDCPTVLITPHVGGSTSAFEPRIVDFIADQLHRAESRDELANLIDTASAHATVRPDSSQF